MYVCVVISNDPLVDEPIVDEPHVGTVGDEATSGAGVGLLIPAERASMVSVEYTSPRESVDGEGPAVCTVYSMYTRL